MINNQELYQRVYELLKNRPTQRSNWEFVKFIVEANGENFSRQVQAVLVEIRRLFNLQQELENRPQTLAIKTELNEIQLMIEQANTWLSQFSQEELATALDTLENQEDDYWPRRLGREAALDLMSQGRVGRDTLEKALLLSEADYRTFTMVCGNITKMINQITLEVEQEQGLSVPGDMPK